MLRGYLYTLRSSFIRNNQEICQTTHTQRTHGAARYDITTRVVAPLTNTCDTHTHTHTICAHMQNKHVHTYTHPHMDALTYISCICNDLYLRKNMSKEITMGRV